MPPAPTRLPGGSPGPLATCYGWSVEGILSWAHHSPPLAEAAWFDFDTDA